MEPGTIRVELFRSTGLKLFFRGSDLSCDFVLLACGHFDAKLLVLHKTVVQTTFLLNLTATVVELTHGIDETNDADDGMIEVGPSLAQFLYTKDDDEVLLTFVGGDKSELSTEIEHVRYLFQQYTLFAHLAEVEKNGNKYNISTLSHDRQSNRAAQKVEGCIIRLLALIIYYFD